MSSVFMDVIQALESPTIARRVEAPIRESYARCHLGSMTSSSFSETAARIITFTNELHSGLGWPEMNDETALGIAMRLLNVHSLESFYSACRLGTDKGIHGVFEKLRDALIEEHTRGYVNYILSTTVNPSSYEEIYDLMSEYHSRFARYLDMDVRRVEHMCLNWRDILLDHARVISRIRGRIGHF